MNIKLFNIIIVLISFWPCSAHSQIECEVPDPPQLEYVSVQPESGFTELTWALSPSVDIAAYIIYSYENGDGIPIDTIWNPLASNYLVSNTATKYKSVSFVVAAYRLPVIPGMDGCPSPLSNDLNTIYAKPSIDTCNKKITVSWNSYASYPKKVTDYSILWSINGGNFTEAGNVSSDINSFIINDFTIDTEYYFVVRANLEGGGSSTSNKSFLLTKMQKPPGWINADYATVNSDNTISLSFTVDPLSEITRFKLERKSGSSGTFSTIAQLSSMDNSVLYIDNQVNINQINYYRLGAVNNCNTSVILSNLCSNIVLSLEKEGDALNLSWNSYQEWLGIISSYRLFINTGNGFEEKAVLQSTDTLFTIGYDEIMYNITGDNICFYISAYETSNPYMIMGQSLSSRVCTVPTELITVPNVFTPNNGTINAYFRPILSFTPINYYLVISDRRGTILFETNDYYESWDGTKNGHPYPQGVCLWFLKVTTPSGKIISKTGTITIINSR